MSARRRWGAAVVVVLGASIVAGCNSGQDPGVTPASSGPSTTSRLVGPCPDGGPDETTPPVGCLDDEGNLVTTSSTN